MAILRRVKRGLVGLWLSLAAASGATAEQITLFAAASLRDAVDEIAREYEAATGVQVVAVYAGSSQIARQVAAGAPADVVLSANRDWIDWLVQQAVVDPDHVVEFASNQLVLVASEGDAMTNMPDLSALLDGGHLAMALTEAVPAGIYGRAALIDLGQWEAVAPQVVEAQNVRDALRLVARGEVPLAIGYLSDLAAYPDLVALWDFPAESHPPIRYAGAFLTPQGAAFMDRLTGPEGQATLARWGFAPPPSAP